MKAGKISEAVLKRSVLKTVNSQLKQKDASKAGVGIDAGLFAVPGNAGNMAVACAAVAGNNEGMAELAVYRACNSLLAAGGISYTLGAVIYLVKKPNITPRFGFHELFHIFVLLGSLFHFIMIFCYIA